jgi:hypothetical protein
MSGAAHSLCVQYRNTDAIENLTENRTHKVWKHSRILIGSEGSNGR